MEAVRRKERSEAHLFLTVEIFTDNDLQMNHGPELLELEEMKGRLESCDQYRMLSVHIYTVYMH